MNDEQEDKFGMLLKTQHFLSVNAADLAVNTLIAAHKVTLDNHIAAITLQDVIASTDDSGFTVMKTNAENALEENLLLVSRGLHGYYKGLGDEDKVRKVDLLKSEVLNARDASLNTQAEIIYGIASPVKALLAPHLVAEADVDNLNTKRIAFLGLITVPKEKVGDKTAAHNEMNRLFSVTTKFLDDDLDAQMSVYESANPILFDKYTSARGIDNSGGGSGSDGYDVSNYTIIAGGSMQFEVGGGGGSIPVGADVYMRAINGNLLVCTTNMPASPCVSGSSYALVQGVTFKGLFSGLNLDMTKSHAQFTNTSTEDVIVRAGEKVV